MISLWVATAFLLKTKKKWIVSLLTAFPATFMTAISVTYILVADEGFKLPSYIGYTLGLMAALLIIVNYALMISRKDKLRATNI